jgi:formate hydrogenlyase subunit 6/NADH:ubiquinone oxidoreductase subunit I
VQINTVGEINYIKNSDWQKFLKRLLLEYNLIAPFEGIGELEYQVVTSENLEKVVYSGARLTQPIKFFVYPPQQTVAQEASPSTEKTVILGVKACDLRAFSALDKIFLGGDFVDPFYKTRRENTLLISNDCTGPLEVCFCELLGDSPFAEEGFDLNLSFIDGGVLVDAGSQEGRKLLEAYNVPLKPAEEAQLKLREKKREESVKKLKEINKEFGFGEDIPGLLKVSYDSPVWQEFSETCVGCCACTNICPACHCFLLSEENLEKVQTWDSCQSTGFARAAGGAHPRKKLMERFRNRFYCKLLYKPENFELFGCTGCGRCIEACQGKIDIREPLTKAARNKSKK